MATVINRYTHGHMQNRRPTARVPKVNYDNQCSTMQGKESRWPLISNIATAE